jgi:hypothetical protein
MGYFRELVRSLLESTPCHVRPFFLGGRAPLISVSTFLEWNYFTRGVCLPTHVGISVLVFTLSQSAVAFLRPAHLVVSATKWHFTTRFTGLASIIVSSRLALSSTQFTIAVLPSTNDFRLYRTNSYLVLLLRLLLLVKSDTTLIPLAVVFRMLSLGIFTRPRCRWAKLITTLLELLSRLVRINRLARSSRIDLFDVLGGIVYLIHIIL